MSKNWGGIKLWYQKNHILLLGTNFYIKPRGRKHRVERVGAFGGKVGQLSPKLLVFSPDLMPPSVKGWLKREMGIQRETIFMLKYNDLREQILFQQTQILLEAF